MRAPRARAPVVRCGTDRSPFLRAVPPPAQARGCKGRSPLHMKSKNLPLPRRGRGAGGWGQETKRKAGQAGDKESKPPLRIPERQGQPAIKQASPPADTTAARSAGNQPGKPPQKNHSNASSSRKAVTKPRAAASSDASAKIRRRGSVPENRQITKELSAK